MLHDTLIQYLQSIEAAIRRIRSAHVERYEEEILGRDWVNMGIRLRRGMEMETYDVYILASQRNGPVHRGHQQRQI